MKIGIFRPVEFWKASLMTLPENVFFELLRTVFGKIKTPFNKQILLSDLEKFLSQNDIQNNIACYLDYNDSRIIAGVAVLDEPEPAELETFFAGEINNAELYSIVISLEERFIIYRFREEGKSRLSLNPVLEPVLSGIAADRHLLFESVSPDEVPRDEMPQPFVFDDRILAALFSFVSQTETFYKRGGSIRQKIINEIGVIFPNFPPETIIGGLRVLGLFTEDGEQLLPDYRRFRDFGSLGRRERMEYCAAGIYFYCHKETVHSVSPWLLRSKFNDFAVFIHNFIDLLDTEQLYCAGDLRKMVYTLHRNQDTSFDFFTGALEKTGLLVPVSDRHWRVQKPLAESASDSPVIAADAPYSFLVYPEITYNDVMILAAFSRISDAGKVVRFELNRDCAMRAFNRDIPADTMINLLQKLSHNRIDENMIFTLRDWEKRYGEIRLLNGVVLTLAPEHRYLAQTRPLAGLITETLAPGIYLLPQTAQEKAAMALRRAGAVIFSGQGKNQTENESPAPLRSFYPHLHSSLYHVEKRDRVPPPEKKHSPSILTESFHSILKRMRPGGDDHDELASRIDRRMILCESQLQDAVVRYEKLEARGLDYTGKALVARQAVSLQSPVEIHLSGPKKERIFGIPKALEKTEKDNVLVIEQPGESLRIPLGKISVLRRIKKSVFENKEKI